MVSIDAKNKKRGEYIRGNKKETKEGLIKLQNTNTNKYTNQTKEEIGEYLKVARKLINHNKYYISENKERKKNIDFRQKYNLNSKKRKEMLLALDVGDFCYSVDNKKDLKERLYVFAKDYKLDAYGDIENVSMYIKMVIKELDEDEALVVISFHEREKKIKKLFEE